jgi:hypothetical protein
MLIYLLLTPVIYLLRALPYHIETNSVKSTQRFQELIIFPPKTRKKKVETKMKLTQNEIKENIRRLTATGQKRLYIKSG